MHMLFQLYKDAGTAKNFAVELISHSCKFAVIYNKFKSEWDSNDHCKGQVGVNILKKCSPGHKKIFKKSIDSRVGVIRWALYTIMRVILQKGPNASHE